MIKIKKLAAAYTILLLLLPLVTICQTADKPDAFAIARKPLETDVSYLKAIAQLKEIESECMATEPERTLYLQAALTCNAFILNNPETYRLQKLMYRINETNKDQLSENINIDSIINQIVDRAAGHQVVMINDRHWLSNSRYLTNLLLKKFYENGFRYLAMEAIFEDSDSLSKRGYPDISTGFYTFDPRMSNLMRDAIDMGFRLVQYDYYGDDDREYMQALNLYNSTLKTDKNAKVLVYSGEGHSNKCPSNKLMGYHFKEISSIDPYIIWQTKTRMVVEGYKGITLEEPTNTCSYDLGVVNGIPETEFLFRPYEEQTEIKITDYISSNILNSTPSILAFYLQNEFTKSGLKAIPVACYLVNDDIHTYPIKLPSDKYVITVRDSEGDILFQKSIEI